MNNYFHVCLAGVSMRSSFSGHLVECTAEFRLAAGAWSAADDCFDHPAPGVFLARSACEHQCMRGSLPRPLATPRAVSAGRSLRCLLGALSYSAPVSGSCFECGPVWQTTESRHLVLRGARCVCLGRDPCPGGRRGQHASVRSHVVCKYFDSRGIEQCQISLRSCFGGRQAKQVENIKHRYETLSRRLYPRRHATTFISARLTP